jgi:predicted trehalose synthase
MSDIPSDLFHHFYNRAPTDQERSRLMAVKAHIGLSSNDELWPFIIMQDHYTQSHILARAKLVKEVNAEVTRFEKIMAQSDRVAQIKAQKAVETMIDKSAAQIAEAAIEKATIPSALLAKQKLTSGIFIGALLTLIFTAIGAGLMYFWLFTQGVCESSERRLNGDARLTCVVQRLPFSA